MSTTTCKTEQEYRMDYFEARVESRSTTDIATRSAAWRKAERIARNAERAGYTLDEADIDEQARRFVITSK